MPNAQWVAWPGACVLGRQLDWAKGVLTMAGVFGKDPNMNKAGGQKELDRIMGERLRKKALAAARFLQKKPAASANKTEPVLKK